MRNTFTRRRVLAIASACIVGAAIAIVFALLSRGGGDEAAPELPPEPAGSAEVRAAIESATATRNADDCDRLATPRYLRQYERRGRSALAACQKGVFEQDRGLLASDVGIQVVRVSKGEALALVTYRGGGYAGITARLKLVRDAKDRWVLDRIAGFASPTRRQMNRALVSEIASGPVPFGAGAGHCAARALRGASESELEAFLLEASPDELFVLVARCDREAFVAALVGEIREAGASIRPAQEGCYRAAFASSPPGSLVSTLVRVEENGLFASRADCAGGRVPAGSGA